MRFTRIYTCKMLKFILGIELSSYETANEICSSELGEGYRMAEFHDGRYVIGMGLDMYYGATWPSSTSRGGWAFYAYGDELPETRFWLYINDQMANCWNNL